tara:strand:- start:1355 stop:2029 length:675 start_codon:yes stop_codon:yes gene_type:complete
MLEDLRITLFLVLIFFSILFGVPVWLTILLKNKTPSGFKERVDDSNTLIKRPVTKATLTLEKDREMISTDGLQPEPRESNAKPNKGDFQSANRSYVVVTVRTLIVFSILVYTISLAMPFHFLSKDHPGGGLFALTIGIIYFPFWLPNPLFFIAIALAAKWRMLASSIFAFAAVFISGGLIVSNPEIHPGDFLEHTGPIAFVWFSSFLLLLIACVIGLTLEPWSS